MKNLLNRLFHLRPEETGIVIILGIILFGNAVARQVTGIVAISGLITEGSVYQVLIVWVIDYGIILLTGGLQSLVVDRVDRYTLIKWITLAFAIIFTLTRLMFFLKLNVWFNYAVLYILAEQQYIFFPLVFWVLANDIFDMAQAKRLFPIIASWNFIGVIFGTFITAFSPEYFNRLNLPQENILLFNTFIYILIFFVVMVCLRQIKRRATVYTHEPVGKTLTEGWGFIREVPSFRYLMLAMILVILCDTIIEFHFLVITNNAFPTQEGYQRFYSLYRMGLNISIIVVQGFLASRIIEKVRLKNIFFLYPIQVVAGALGLIFSSSLGMAVYALGGLRFIRDTVDENSRKAFQALVPEERRGRVSTFMDTYLPAVGTILGCLLIGIIVAIGIFTNNANFYYVYLGVAVIAGLVSLWIVRKMKKSYDSSMLNWRLKRRQRGASVLDNIDL